MAKLILIVGGTGSGKTSLTKKLITNKKHIIFDVNKEYKGYTVFDFEKNISDFLEYIKDNKILNTQIIIDEASIHFHQKNKNKLLNELLTLKRHYNNNYYLIFHSLVEVPQYIYTRCDMLILFKTNDLIKNVILKYTKSSVYNAFIKVSNLSLYSFQILDFTKINKY